MLVTLSAHDCEVRHDVRAAQAGQVIYKWKQRLNELPADARVQKVILGRHSYSRVGIVMLTAYLKPLISNVTEVDLSGIVTSQEGEDDNQERVAGLTILCDLFRDCQLVEVNVSSNHVGDDVVKVCESVLAAQTKTLKHLFLKNMAWSAEGMKKVADLLTQDKNGTCLAQRLQTLHFHHEPNDDGGAEQFRRILSASTQLHNIRYSGCQALVEGSNALGAAFDKMEDRISVLQKLSLAGSNFGTGNGISLFATALETSHRLTHLNLRNCQLGIKGTSQVCNALRKAQVRLVELDLSQHNIGPEGVIPVTNLIKTTVTTLRVFKCQENKLTSRGVKRLVNAFSSWQQPCCMLEQLHLANNECGSIGADSVVNATMPNLQIIDLNHNCFSWDELKRLDDCFGSKLQKMDGNNNLRDADAEYNLKEADRSRDEIDDFFSNIAEAISLILEPCGVVMEKNVGPY